MSQTTIDLLGQPFTVDWQSTDRRLIANRESQKCFELVSFDGFDHDRDKLRKALPVKIEKRWLPNRDYQSNARREKFEWHRATGSGFDRRDGKRPEIAGFYYPPEARGLRLIDPQKPEVSKISRNNMHAAGDLYCISKSEFAIPFSGPAAAPLSKPGMSIFLATFEDGDFLFLKNLAECAVPDEAKAQWETSALLEATKQVLHKSQQTAAELEAAKLARAKAEEASRLTIKEALKEWMRFEPPRMRVDTKAKIEKAVRLYLTLPGKHSLAKIAQEFSVSRTTVSRWFKKFSEETGFRVVTHQRHESVKVHLNSESMRSDADENDGDSTR